MRVVAEKPDAPVALVGVRVFDGERLSEPRTVVISGGVFTNDPEDATSFDADGAVLIPGLIDAHLHLQDPANLVTLAQWGVTTALDMACWPYERVEQLRAATSGADFRTAGLPAIGPHGHHADVPGLRPGIVTSEAAARGHVAEQVRHRIDYVKAVAEAPGEGGPDPDVLTAVVDAAHEHRLRAIIHAKTLGAYTSAVASGADIVTHTPTTGRIPTDSVDALANDVRAAVPTLVTMMGEATGDDPLVNAAALHAAGVTILAGTDASSAPGSPVPHGSSLHDELELLVRAGLSTAQALRAATSTTARFFGLTDRGAIKPGMRADAVLLNANPIADIRATRDIRAVWCAGTLVPFLSSSADESDQTQDGSAPRTQVDPA